MPAVGWINDNVRADLPGCRVRKSGSVTSCPSVGHRKCVEQPGCDRTDIIGLDPIRAAKAAWTCPTS
jgi:hypothetical protein